MVEKIEELAGRPINEWTMENFKDIVTNKEIIQYLNEDDSRLKELFESYKESGSDKELLAELELSYLGVSFDSTRSKVGSLCKEADEANPDNPDYSKALEAAEEVIKTGNKFEKLIGYFIKIAYLPEERVEEIINNKEEIKNVVLEAAKTINSFDVDKSFLILDGVLDIIYPIMESFFERTGEKLEGGIEEEVEKAQSTFENYSLNLYQNYMKMAEKIGEELAKDVPVGTNESEDADGKK